MREGRGKGERRASEGRAKGERRASEGRGKGEGRARDTPNHRDNKVMITSYLNFVINSQECDGILIIVLFSEQG